MAVADGWGSVRNLLMTLCSLLITTLGHLPHPDIDAGQFLGVR